MLFHEITILDGVQSHFDLIKNLRGRRAGVGKLLLAGVQEVSAKERLRHLDCKGTLISVGCWVMLGNVTEHE